MCVVAFAEMMRLFAFFFLSQCCSCIDSSTVEIILGVFFSCSLKRMWHVYRGAGTRTKTFIELHICASVTSVLQTSGLSSVCVCVCVCVCGNTSVSMSLESRSRTRAPEQLADCIVCLLPQ